MKNKINSEKKDTIVVIDLFQHRTITPVEKRADGYYSFWSHGYISKEFKIFPHGTTSCKGWWPKWHPFVTRWEPISDRMQKYYKGYIGFE